ncbi:SEL1-like repeat protein [Salmonella enterica]|nr:SEL1-like repeat protein [Salmonella enterica]
MLRVITIVLIFFISNSSFADLNCNTINKETKKEDLLELGVSFYGKNNFILAKCLFEESAKKGSSEAYFLLAGMYFHGIGVPIDKVKAEELIQKSAEITTDEITKGRY